MRSDYIVSTLASVSVACSSIVLFAWIGRALSPDDLGFFSQIRRVSAMWVPVSTLGVSLALSRYLRAFAGSADDTPSHSSAERYRRGDARASRGGAQRRMERTVSCAGDRRAHEPGVAVCVSAPWTECAGGPLCCVGLHRIRLAAGLQVTGYALWPLVCLAYEPGAALEALVLRIGVGQSLIGVTSLALIAGVVRPLRQPAEPVQADRLGALLAYGLAPSRRNFRLYPVGGCSDGAAPGGLTDGGCAGERCHEPGQSAGHGALAVVLCVVAAAFARTGPT